MKFKTEEMKKLFNRVYTDKMKENDEKDLIECFNRVFGDRDVNPDPAMVHNFNNLIVAEANKVAKPMITDVLKMMSRYRTANRGDLVRIDLPRNIKTKFVLSSNGTTTDFIKAGKGTSIIAQPKVFETGFSYNPNEFGVDAVDKFRELINDVATAKLKLYLGEFYRIVSDAVTNIDIPEANVKVGDNIDLTDYFKVASVISRRGGGRALFIADQILVDHFALQLPNTGSTNIYQNLLSDMTKDMLLRDLVYTQIGRTNAFNITNDFTNLTNSKVELPVNKGFFVAGERSAFEVVEFGGMRQKTHQDFETDEIYVDIKFEADIVLPEPYRIGYIQDNTIQL